MALHAQVTLLTSGADPADNQTNGFAIATSSFSTANLDAWVVAIKDFYDDIRFLGGCLGLAQNNHIVKVYDILGAPPNYPIYENTFNLGGAPGAVQMPQEVALCVSYSNTVLNSVPRARRRGRIYLSGWAESFNDAGRPVEANLQAVADAYGTYAGTVNGIADFEAGVWSRANATVYPIDYVWVDNEWDTQRSRGGKATERYDTTV